MYYVYILTNKIHSVLYVGVTNSLARRIYEHKNRLNPNCFTSRYNVNKLVYYEQYSQVVDAIEREKQLKSGKRTTKEGLITSSNPGWNELDIS